MDFAKFDSMVNKDELKKQMDAAPEYDDVPAGVYLVEIEKMEVKLTKNKDKLMFSTQFGIVETINAPKKQDKRKLFWNRVICGNKTTDKWNDGVAIKGVITWLKGFLDDDDPLVFESYSQFAEDVLDIFQEVAQDILLKIDYKPDDFNPITIMDVIDK